jgi:hypothetical protein
MEAMDVASSGPIIQGRGVRSQAQSRAAARASNSVAAARRKKGRDIENGQRTAPIPAPAGR